ncbi:hypothetical protein [Bosea vaviloviae]|uniref:Uncharacterized protein n=1 Tax=Bosea vaviloviae TaxID=1526658 RepID=A0A0N0MB73_9HYPH|nr:hypothetical protein [Bosea vaviloviae]KPH80549.1 hypothetical protein AE618_12305 [Bosea vaviloviae]
MASATRLSDEAREAAWHAMCVLTAEYKAFSVATIANLTPGAAYPPIAEWVGWLQREMVLKPAGPQRLAVAVISQLPPPRNRMTNGRGAQQQRQIWTAMRKLRSWTDQDLVEAAATDECEMTLNAVRNYSRALAKVGIVQVTATLTRLKPARDTGPRAPVSFSDGSVFDLNLGDFVNPNSSRRAA